MLSRYCVIYNLNQGRPECYLAFLAEPECHNHGSRRWPSVGDTGGFFVFLYFHFLSAVTETYIRWKKSQQVCHTPRQRWGRDTGYCRLLDKVSPSQWVAIGVLGSLLFGLLTYLTNLYFKIREDRRKAARGE